MKTDRSGRTFEEYRQLFWDEQKRIEVLQHEVDMWRKHVPELEATIMRVEALFSEIEKIEAAGDDIHTPWLVIMFEQALGEAK